MQCTPENYAEVASAIEGHMKRRKTEKRASGKIAGTGLSRPHRAGPCGQFSLFPLAEEFDTGLLMPLFILCFALAMVWLINLFGWVVIGGLIVQAGLVVLNQMEVRESWLHKGESHRAWEVLGGDDISLLLVAGIGAGVLVWLSLQALRGRWLVALLEGYKDMGA